MFKLGRPVGAYDVGELVNGTVALRRTASTEKDGALGKLIEQVLLEFQSLQDTDGSGPRGASSASKAAVDSKAADPKEATTVRPPPPDVRERISRFENVADWAAELDDPPASKDREARSEREARSGRTPTTESAVVPTMKATPLALAGAVAIGEVEEVSAADTPSGSEEQEDSPVATLRESPKAKADTVEAEPVAESKAAESKPAETKAVESKAVESAAPTLKATPAALAAIDEAKESTTPTLKATPAALAEGEAKDAPAAAAKAGSKTGGGKAKAKGDKGKAKPRTAGEGGSKVEAIEVAAPREATRAEPEAPKSSSPSKALLVLAALAVVVALLYFGGVLPR
jgi:hypothetical protein